MHNLLQLCTLCLALTIISCKPTIEKKVPSVVEDRPVFEEEITDASPSETIVSATYTTPGILINMPVRVTIEHTYSNKKIIKTKRLTNSGGMGMEFVTHFDNDGKELEFNTIQNGKQSVNQKNEYDGDLLVKEFRVENASEGLDTFIYEYVYEDKNANPLKYTRTNNGTKVTEMTLTKKGSEEILVETAVGSKNYTGITTTVRKKDSKGNIISEQQTSITSDWSDKDKLDTTIYAPVITEYNNEGLITRTFSEGSNSLMDGEVKSFYKNGIIVKNIISKKGKSPITVNYRKIR